jgi:hypothetical protein
MRFCEVGDPEARSRALVHQLACGYGAAAGMPRERCRSQIINRHNDNGAAMSEEQHKRARAKPQPRTTDNKPVGTRELFTPPTPEEEQYLNSVGRSVGDYDRSTIVGGPRKSAA